MKIIKPILVFTLIAFICALVIYITHYLIGGL